MTNDIVYEHSKLTWPSDNLARVACRCTLTCRVEVIHSFIRHFSVFPQYGRSKIKRLEREDYELRVLYPYSHLVNQRLFL